MTPFELGFLVLVVASFLIFMVTLAGASWYVEHDQETPGDMTVRTPHQSRPSAQHTAHA